MPKHFWYPFRSSAPRSLKISKGVIIGMSKHYIANFGTTILYLPLLYTKHTIIVLLQRYRVKKVAICNSVTQRDIFCSIVTYYLSVINENSSSFRSISDNISSKCYHSNLDHWTSFARYKSAFYWGNKCLEF